MPLGRFGQLPEQSAVVELPLSGAYQHQTGLNANGIARTPDGSALLIVQSSTGLLFRVDPATGVTTAVDLGGELLTNWRLNRMATWGSYVGEQAIGITVQTSSTGAVEEVCMPF